MTDKKIIEKALRDLDDEWSDLASGEGLDWVPKIYAPDATLVWPGEGPVQGIKNVVNAWTAIKEQYNQPTLRYGPDKFHIADSGELATDFGNVFISFMQDGVEQQQFGKYLVIWKKQEDSTWKVLYDSWNSND